MPSFIGTRNALIPTFFPSIRSLANTIPIAGTPRGLVGGIILKVIDISIQGIRAMNLLRRTCGWRVEYESSSIIDRSLSLKVDYIETVAYLCQHVVTALFDGEQIDSCASGDDSQNVKVQ